ncbi:MAG: radical SAM protein, partial [Deltaproteobacteria bacterium]|nr:radical SAM protein [Deltaproteobacteria bacterium]
MEAKKEEKKLSPKCISVYVHFPYCLRKCPYCDFDSFATDPKAIPSEKYTERILREFELRSALISEYRLISIFFGGGTPSLWDPKSLAIAIQKISSAFGVAPDEIEITLEANPSSFDEERAHAFRKAGVNRFSIGVQALESTSLRFLGRSHSPERAIQAVCAARKTGSRVNADIIFGLPGVAIRTYLEAIDRLVEAGARHISAYALTNEEGTHIGELHRQG